MKETNLAYHLFADCELQPYLRLPTFSNLSCLSEQANRLADNGSNKDLE